MTAFSADKIFTGDEWLEQHAIVIEDDHITDVLPTSSLPRDASIKN
jgi:N-acetylglucosamine-6-phosphate deacetylase